MHFAMGIHINSFLKCLYFFETLNYLESKVFIASTPSEHPKTVSEQETYNKNPERMPELWIRTLYPKTPTPSHPTMWVCRPADCDGFILDLGGRIPINTLELGIENNEST